jgi:O-antigen ligase
VTAAGDWPRTGRALPWLLATFLVVLWLVPFDAIELPIPLPIDPHPDRFLLFGLVLAAFTSILANRRYAPSTPVAGVSLALLGFTAVALVSLVLNSQTLVSLGQFDQGVRQLALLVSILAVFLVVATIVRPSELRNFGVLIVVLATIAAIGTIYEYRTDYNVFYDLAGKLFGGFASVQPVPDSELDFREESFGPTQHGLAMVTMLTLALPFAMVGLFSARTRGHRVLYGFAVLLIFAGAVCTQRKTSIVAPAAAILVLAAYRPRQMLRLAPIGAAMLVAIHLVAPAALGGVYGQITGGFFESSSTVGRTSDYEAIKPDMATHPMLGRGYGTIDPQQSDTNRILDNQYLGWLVQVGFLGLAAYLALLAAAMALAHSVIRRARDPDSRHTGLAALAGFVAFAVASALFDLASFIQVPYLFCFIAGLCSVAAAARAPQPVGTRAEAPTRKELPAT